MQRVVLVGVCCKKLGLLGLGTTIGRFFSPIFNRTRSRSRSIDMITHEEAKYSASFCISAAVQWNRDKSTRACIR